MTEKVSESDIDRFILEQKKKLASEKREFKEDGDTEKAVRRRWEEPNKENLNISGLTSDRQESKDRPETPARQGYPVDNRQVIKQRKQLSEERKNEYNNFLKAHSNNRRKPRNMTPTRKSLELTNSMERLKEELKKERRADYHDHLVDAQKKIKKNQLNSHRARDQPSDLVARQQEYINRDLQLELDSLDDNSTDLIVPTPKAASLPIGNYEEYRKQKAPEIKRLYRADLEKQLKEKEKIKNLKLLERKPPVVREKARNKDSFKKQIRVQGSPRKSAEKFKPVRFQTPPELRSDVNYAPNYEDFNSQQNKYKFESQDEYDQWQLSQIQALNDIQRRNLQLRLKLEREQQLRQLQKELSPRQPTDVYLPEDRQYLDLANYENYDRRVNDYETGRESPEPVYIGELSKQEQQRQKEKFREERQREYREMMSQKPRPGPKRTPWNEEDDHKWGIFGDGNFIETLRINPKKDIFLLQGIDSHNDNTNQKQITSSNHKKAISDSTNQAADHVTKVQTNGNRSWREPSKEDLLVADKRDDIRRRLEEERKNEYNQYLQKTKREKVMWREPLKEELLISDKGDNQKQLQEERKQEYKQLLQKNVINRREWREPSKEDLLIQNQAAERRKKLDEERRNEYKQLLESKPRNNRDWKVNDEEKPLLVDRQERKKESQRQRNEDYNKIKNSKNARNNDLPPKPGTPGGFLNKLGSHEKQRQKLQEERQLEYKRIQAEKFGLYRDFTDPKMLLKRDEEIYATLPGINYHGSATRRTKIQERNEEYNDVKKILETPRSRRGDDGPGAPRKGWGTPTYEEMLEKKRGEEQNYRRANDPDYSKPGLKSFNSDGDLHRLEDEKRLRDIQRDLATTRKSGVLDDPDWLRAKTTDPDLAYSRLLDRLKNWNADTQEDDILSKETPPKTRPQRIEKQTPPGKPSPKQDNELPTHGRGVRAPPVREYPPKGIKESPTYLPEDNKHRFYATLPVGHKENNDELQKRKENYKRELERQMKEAEEAKKRNKTESREPVPPVSEKQQPVPQQAFVVVPNNQSLPDVVPNPVAQQQYQLLSGIDRLSPRSEMLLGRTRDLERLERRLKKIEQQNAAISPLDIAELDFMSKRDPRNQFYPSGPTNTGILEQGFDRLLEPPKVGSVKIPAGLEYTPSTFVTGANNHDKYSAIDQAYHYYGSRNPLDIPAAPVVGTQYGAAPVNVGQVVVDNTYQPTHGGGGGGGFSGGGGYSPVPPLNMRNVQEDMNEETDAERKAKQRAQAQQYQRELERQMEEKNYKKHLDREEKERYERKLEDDIRNYNPYGRGGGGAPMKDSSGNVVADLRAVQKGYSPRYDPYTSPTRAGPRPASPKDDLIKTPPLQTTAEGESTYARGGHGIFGNPKTEAEKTQADKYKEELKRQIDKKKHDAELEKEKERREEERQQRIIDEQRRKMQEEYDEEKRRIQAKEDEARKQNEQIIKLQGDRKTEEERLRAELEQKKREEARLNYEKEREEREKARVRSPPIPSLRTGGENADTKTPADDTNDQTKTEKPKTSTTPASLSSLPSSPVNQPSGSKTPPNSSARKTPPTSAVRKSPPIPAVKHANSSFDRRDIDSPLIPALRNRHLDVYSDERPPRNNSADVLNQLAHMRRQLQNERQRVENMLEETRNEPEVFDPRTVALAPRAASRPAPVTNTQRNDIFETALNRNAVQVRRAGTADLKVLQDFDNLKYKEDTDSRKQFRKLYPSDPRSQEELESQQAAFIRQQEDRLQRLARSPSVDGVGLSGSSPQNMLHSNSAFIDVDNMDRNLFPDDFEDFPKRNDSARERRRQRENDRNLSRSPRGDVPKNYNPMGSVTSLDVDKISRKNEDRLRRLKEIQGDDLSLYDPDDVINRFMDKQSHIRPPSNNTLHDDSWLLPGNKRY